MSQRVALALVVSALLALDTALLVYSVVRGPFPVTVPLGTPLAYRNIYIHVPIALSTYMLFAGAALAGLLSIIRGRVYSRYIDTFVALGVVYAAATLVTGSAWASESWGVAWNWDPKQTAVLMLFLAYLAYFPLKRSIADPERRERVAAAYATAAFALVPVSYLSSRIFQSLHPTTEAIAQYAESGPGGALLIARIAVVALLTLSLALARARGYGIPWALPALYALTGLAIGLGVFAGTVGTGADRVVDVDVDDEGRIRAVTLADGRRIEFEKPLESPIRPAVTAEGVSTLLSHLVRPLDGEGLVLLYHWSTPLSYFIHITIITLAAALAVAGTRGGGEV